MKVYYIDLINFSLFIGTLRFCCLLFILDNRNTLAPYIFVECPKTQVSDCTSSTVFVIIHLLIKSFPICFVCAAPDGSISLKMAASNVKDTARKKNSLTFSPTKLMAL